MPAALPQDLCWRIVEKYWLDGVGPATISQQLGTSVRPLSKRQIRVVLRRFARTGEVATHQGRRLADPANTIFSHDEDMRLLELVTVLDDKSMLQESIGARPRSNADTRSDRGQHGRCWPRRLAHDGVRRAE